MCVEGLLAIGMRLPNSNRLIGDLVRSGRSEEGVHPYPGKSLALVWRAFTSYRGTADRSGKAPQD